MRFASPLALLLLLILPLVALIGLPEAVMRRGAHWRRWGREIVSTGIRLLILTLWIFALAGLEIVQASEQLAVVFLLDSSDSMSVPEREQALEYVARALESKPPDDQAALVVFGGDALVERPMSPSPEITPVRSTPDESQTDMAEAIRLGLALFPPGAARRIVILSDGAETIGDAEAAAALARASGVDVSAIPIGEPPAAEVILRDVAAPARLHSREQFNLDVRIFSTVETEAVIRVIAAESLVYEAQHSLLRGSQTFSIPLAAPESGFTRFQINIEPQQDTHVQNNRFAAYTQVSGPPQILVITPGEGVPDRGTGPFEADALLEELRSARMAVTDAPPGGLPSDLPTLARYEAVVLVDVPALDLSQRQMETLQRYVRDLGGGLTAVGGPSAFGVGGYFRTPLEETLPIEMQVRDEERRPSLAIVFVIDKSGSMSDTSGGVAKIELAKEAALRSLELLFPGDAVGVVIFDESASWALPITQLDDPAALQQSIASIRSGGGTDILAGVQAVAGELPEYPASIKHVILLTDGGADPTGIPELVRQMNQEHGITLSAVGVGADAAPFLPSLAEEGGGRYHFAAEAASIPRIFTAETSLAARSYIVEETFFPVQTAPSVILSGINETPPLYGYVASTRKDVARMVLASERGDPILAEWQYGLGRAVAFTSDATGRWGREWVVWEGFPAFWRQVINSTIQEETRSPVEVRVQENARRATEGMAQVIVEAQSEDGNFLNRYAMQASIIAPGGDAQQLILEQAAPGRYEGAFVAEEEGAYLLRVTGAPEDPNEDQGITDVIGWVRSYTPEYRITDQPPRNLCRLASQPEACLNQAASLAPEQVFRHDLPTGFQRRPAWPWLLALSALLLPLDIGVRRLVLSSQEVRRWLEQLRDRLLPDRQTDAEAEPTPRLESLMRAKLRAVGKPEDEEFPVDTRPLRPEREGRRGEERATEKPSQHEEEKRQQPRETAASLLRSKRRRSENDED